MRVFLTGGSGFVGSRLIEMHAQSMRFTALQRHNPVAGNVTRVKADLLDLESLSHAVRGCECIIHLGGSTPNRAYLEGSYEATISGTRNLIIAARDHHIRRFIFVSADCVTHSRGPYALSKHHAEKDIRESGLTWTIFRPRTVVGSSAKDLGRMMAFWSKARWIPVIGDGRCLKQPVFVDDLCQAIVLSLGDPSCHGKTITVAGPDSISFNNFVRAFSRYLGNQNCKLVHLPLPLAYSMAVIANVLNPRWGLNRERVSIIADSRSVDISRFAALLEKPPTGFEHMVQQATKEWLAAQGHPFRASAGA